MMHITERGGVY